MKQEKFIQQLYEIICRESFTTVDWTPNKGAWLWGRFWLMLAEFGFRFCDTDIFLVLMKNTTPLPQ